MLRDADMVSLLTHHHNKSVFEIERGLVANITYSQMRAWGAPRNNVLRIEQGLVASIMCSNMRARDAPRNKSFGIAPGH